MVPPSAVRVTDAPGQIFPSLAVPEVSAMAMAGVGSALTYTVYLSVEEQPALSTVTVYSVVVAGDTVMAAPDWLVLQ